MVAAICGRLSINLKMRRLPVVKIDSPMLCSHIKNNLKMWWTCLRQCIRLSIDAAWFPLSLQQQRKWDTLFLSKIVKRNWMHFNRIDCHGMHISSFSLSSLSLSASLFFFFGSLIVILVFFSSKESTRFKQWFCEQIGFRSRNFFSKQFALFVFALVCVCMRNSCRKNYLYITHCSEVKHAISRKQQQPTINTTIDEIKRMHKHIYIRITAMVSQSFFLKKNSRFSISDIQSWQSQSCLCCVQYVYYLIKKESSESIK